MPTIPLYDTSAAEQGWHAVRAPGGFEAWTIHCVDDSEVIEIAAGIFDGYPFHPKYHKRLARFLRNPTRVAPPTPRDFPCVFLSVKAPGLPRDAVVVQHPAGTLLADKGVTHLALGLSRFLFADPGIIRIGIDAFPSRLEMTHDIASSAATGFVIINSKRLELKNCRCKFEHVFSTTPPQGDALARFARGRIISSSVGSQAPS